MQHDREAGLHERARGRDARDASADDPHRCWQREEVMAAVSEANMREKDHKKSGNIWEEWVK